MSETVVSKSGIRFLTPSVLTQCIHEIETRFPGWWWSISQEPSKITVSMAPTPTCPGIEDVAISKTKKGDSGSIQTITDWDKDQEPEACFQDWFSKALDHVQSFRKRLILDHAHDWDKLVSGVTLSTSYRRQDPMDLKILDSEYTRFQSMITGLERYGHHTLHEIYLGSCELSVDCSLRGKHKDGNDFDFSMDFQGKSRLADSLDWCHREWTGEVLGIMASSQHEGSEP